MTKEDDACCEVEDCAKLDTEHRAQLDEIKSRFGVECFSITIN